MVFCSKLAGAISMVATFNKSTSRQRNFSSKSCLMLKEVAQGRRALDAGEKDEALGSEASFCTDLLVSSCTKEHRRA